MASADVDRALRAPIGEVASRLLALNEDQWFDRKSSRIDSRKLAEAMVGMANADGGVLVVGLRSGVVEGVEALGRRLNDHYQVSRDYCSPPVRETHRVVPCIDSEGNKNALLIFDIPPSETYHETVDHRCFLRVGDETRRLSSSEANELRLDRGAGSYEVTNVAGATQADLDMGLLSNYAERVGHPSPLRLLEDRTRSKPDQLTVAGCLLFSEMPTKFLPSALVRVTRYAGRSRSTGRRQQITSDVRCEGSIPMVILSGRSAVRAVQPTRRALTDAGLFEEMPTVPEDAWLEGLVNAVVHRSYSLEGDHVHVDVFDDKIEITSPGRFPQMVNLDEPLKARRFARNPRVIRVCADLKVCQELGEGILRMFEEMRAAGLKDPLYSQSPTSVTLTLSAEPMHRLLDGAYRDDVRRVLTALRNSDRLSTADLVDVVGRSRPSVRRVLDLMRAAQLIEWTGKSPNDPRAFWHLPDGV